MSKPYPWYYAVNDRPVKLVELADGSLDALAFDWATGGFVPDRSYFAKTSDPNGDVDELTEAAFLARVKPLRSSAVGKLRQTPLRWERTDDATVPLRTNVGKATLTLRVNDASTKPRYTLLVEGEVVDGLDAWPDAWQMPPG